MNKKILFSLVFGRVSALLLTAQVLPGLSFSGYQPAGTSFFPQAFTAIGDLDVQSDNNTLKLSMGFCTDGGKTRTYVDVANAGGGFFDPAAAATLRRIGGDRVINIERPDEKTTWEIYPARRAYIEQPYQPELDPGGQPSKTFLGQENVDGHPCRKYELNFPTLDLYSLGPAFHDLTNFTIIGTEWEATDLENFPVQLEFDIQTIGGEFKTRIRWHDIKLGPCDPSLFERPTNYTCYDNLDDLIYRRTPPPAPVSKAELDVRVLKWNQDLAEKGDAYGELRMGLRYRDGDSVPKDADKAREWLQKAADQGDPDAAAALAKLTRPKKAPEVPSTGPVTITSDMVLRSAMFGMGKKEADVTRRVGKLLQIHTNGFAADYKMLGADPLPGKKKHLVVKYEYQGTNFTLSVPGGKQLDQQALVDNTRK